MVGQAWDLGKRGWQMRKRNEVQATMSEQGVVQGYDGKVDGHGQVCWDRLSQAARRHHVQRRS